MKEPLRKKFLKFALVGGIGSVITISLTFIFTQYFHWWYIFSLIMATLVAMMSNFYMNNYWTFANTKSSSAPDYDWDAFYNGNPIQRWWKQQIAQRVISMIEGEYIMDFGCGSSPICTLLNGQHYHGIDGDMGKIEFMRSRKLQNRQFAQATLDDLHLKAISGELPEYDTSMTIEVIEHMPNINKAQNLMNCLSKATAIGGVVIVATPNYDSRLWRAIEKIYGLFMYQAYAYDHVTRLNERMLIDLVRNAGLFHEKTDMLLGADMVCKFRKVSYVSVV